MKKSEQDIDALLMRAVITIRNAPSPQDGWNRSLDAVEYLKRMGPSAVDGLIDTLHSNDDNLVMLAMLYLGILKDEGMPSATRAIDTIYDVTGPDISDTMAIAMNTSLAMLGDEHQLETARKMIPVYQVRNERELFLRNMVKVAKYIADNT